MKEGKVELIKVTLLLKDSCMMPDGKWKCTISGKEHIFSNDRVSYVTTSFEGALESFNYEELDAINIFRGNISPF